MHRVYPCFCREGNPAQARFPGHRRRTRNFVTPSNVSAISFRIGDRPRRANLSSRPTATALSFLSPRRSPSPWDTFLPLARVSTPWVLARFCARPRTPSCARCFSLSAYVIGTLMRLSFRGDLPFARNASRGWTGISSTSVPCRFDGDCADTKRILPERIRGKASDSVYLFLLLTKPRERIQFAGGTFLASSYLRRRFLLESVEFQGYDQDMTKVD